MKAIITFALSFLVFIPAHATDFDYATLSCISADSKYGVEVHVGPGRRKVLVSEFNIFGFPSTIGFGGDDSLLISREIKRFEVSPIGLQNGFHIEVQNEELHGSLVLENDELIIRFDNGDWDYSGPVSKCIYEDFN